MTVLEAGTALEYGKQPPAPAAPQPTPVETYPLVSIGLPVFNGERYLRACLASIVAQTYPRFELIISDNASTDSTSRICEELAARDERVRYHRAERNRGAAWNHNRVLELARGSFFKWCGVDDLLEARFLETCVALLERTPDAVLAYPMSIVINETGEAIERESSELDIAGPDPVARFRSLLRPWAVSHNPFYGVMRTGVLRSVRPLGTFFASDRSLLAELAIRGRFVRTSEFSMYRRRHGYRPTAVEQYFLDPARPHGGYWARESRMLREHFLSALRASGGVVQKMRLVGATVAWALGQRRTLVGDVRALVRHVGSRVGLGSADAAS